MSTIPVPRTSDGLFGRIITKADVELHVREVIKIWIHTYLGEVERQMGIPVGKIPRPRSYHRTDSFDNFVENQLPAIIMVSPGFSRPPTIEGDGQMNGYFAFGVGVIVSARDKESTNNVLAIYLGALMALMLQKRSLGRLAWGCDLIDMSSDELGDEDSRSLAGGQMEFELYIDNITNRQLGPYTWQEPGTEPGQVEPGDDYYKAHKIVIDINNIEVDESLHPPLPRSILIGMVTETDTATVVGH